MIKIHRLKQPNMHSGTPLDPGKTMELRGMLITNKNDFQVHVDKFTRKPWKPTQAQRAEMKRRKKAAEKAGSNS